MKRFLFWLLKVLIGIAVGLAVFFCAVVGGSFYMTTELKLPENEVIFDETALEINGYQWRIPLIGGTFDKQFTLSSTLSVQKVGKITSVRPEFTLPKWATLSTLNIENSAGDIIFEGTLEDYTNFAYPQNGEYRAELFVWHLPENFSKADYLDLGNGAILKNTGLETPAQPTGWYRYFFRFEIDADPQVILSSEKATSGEIVAVSIRGFLGDHVPKILTDLGEITPLWTGTEWRAYLPVSYNTPSGEHEIAVTVADKTVSTVLKVSPKSFGKVYLTDEPTKSTESANNEYRNVIWAIYDDAPTAKAWVGAFIEPLDGYRIDVNYGDDLIRDNKIVGISNSVDFITLAGENVVSPSGGTVAFAGNLALTGNTVVIDHGHGLRTYFFGFETLEVKTGDSILQNQTIGTTGETLTMDIKIANKSVSPWELFRGQGGLFWQEY